MTITYYNDINVYFHMRNHYKHLKNVKSVVDTSIPQSLLKSPMAMNNNLDKRIKGVTNEELRRIYTGSFTQKKKSFFVKRHDCLNIAGKSSQSNRPNTRRNSDATPESTLPPKSHSSTISQCEKMFKFNQKRRRVVASNPDINIENLHLNSPVSQYDRELVPISERSEGGSGSVPVSRRSEGGSVPVSRRSEEGSGSVPVSVSRQSEDRSTSGDGCSKNVSPRRSSQSRCSEEHEYLMFLLRITEEIISNDCFSNSDIKRIFQANVELNKNRLDLKKMHIHIFNLCKELNIDCEEYLRENNLDPDVSDHPPMNFQSSAKSYRFVMSDLFKNCQDCSVIRKSPLHKTQNDFDISDGKYMENFGDEGTSHQKLISKFSLGRVTECTEPAPSTMNSPRPIVTNIAETEEIVDFDTFMKAIDSDKSLLHGVLGSSETTKQSNKENSSISLINLGESTKNEDAQKANSKSCVEFIKNETNVSGKQDFEADVLSKAENKSKEDKVEEKDGEIISATSKINEIIPKSSKIPVLITKSEENLVAELLQAKSTIIGVNADSKISHTRSTSGIDPNFVKTPSTLTIGTNTDSEETPTKQTLGINTDFEKISTKATLGTNTDFENVPTKQTIGINTNIEETQTKETLGIKTDFEIIPSKPLKSSEIIESPALSTSSKASNIHESNESTCQSPVKITLQGTPNQDDYVMIKGPVFIYKPLLESEPKMIIFDNSEKPKSRRSSIDSQHSHRTFTVDNSHIFDPLDLDQGVEYEINEELKPKCNESLKTILSATKTFSQNLLNSDYDLTPEKDNCENKYHYLMVDAKTSISGINLPESLLLNDEYLVKEPSSSESNEFLDKYLNYDSKMLENNYVIHRKLMSSISMPKLKLNTVRLINEKSSNSELSGESGQLKKCASDLMTFDVPSQDSSLRSEGEAVQNYVNGLFWRKF